MKPRKTAHILTGIHKLAERWILDNRPKRKFPLEAMFSCIETNFSPNRPENLSKENWRFTKESLLAEQNKSPEKVLEKKISKFTGGKWANQVPVASGFYQSGGRKRCIDLVFESSDSTFVFYELKVLPTSGKAFDAAIELLGYGLLYIYSRERLDAYKESPLMKARTIHLRVLGTCDYYQKQKGTLRGPSLNIQGAISQSLNQFVLTNFSEFKMDFGFDTFAESFSWSLMDKENKRKIRAALNGIRPLFRLTDLT
jgi:hypothetical protein